MQGLGSFPTWNVPDVTLTILLVVGVKVIHDLTHSIQGEVVWINCEDPPFIHVIWRSHKQSRSVPIWEQRRIV